MNIKCDVVLTDDCEHTLRQLGALIFLIRCDRQWYKIHVCTTCYKTIRPIMGSKVRAGDTVGHGAIIYSPPNRQGLTVANELPLSGDMSCLRIRLRERVDQFKKGSQ